MKLIELNPRWLQCNGENVAMMFLCPHCVGKETSPTWLTCFFKAAADLPRVPEDYPIESLAGSSGARLLFFEALKAIGHADPAEGAWADVVSCKKTSAWTRTSDNFATMSVTPSLDASQSGHWHGFIVDGEVK